MLVPFLVLASFGSLPTCVRFTATAMCGEPRHPATSNRLICAGVLRSAALLFGLLLLLTGFGLLSLR
jgi:hypothetical protein